MGSECDLTQVESIAIGSERTTAVDAVVLSLSVSPGFLPENSRAQKWPNSLVPPARQCSLGPEKQRFKFIQMRLNFHRVQRCEAGIFIQTAVGDGWQDTSLQMPVDQPLGH